MRLIISLFVSLLISPAGFAATPTNHVPELLSYDELMLMSSPERAEYLHQFGKLLVLLEKANGKYEIAGNDVLNMKEQVASLMREFALVPEADAAGNTETATPGVTTPSATPGQLSGPLPLLADPKLRQPDMSDAPAPSRTLINEDTPAPTFDNAPAGAAPERPAVTEVGGAPESVLKSTPPKATTPAPAQAPSTATAPSAAPATAPAAGSAAPAAADAPAAGAPGRRGRPGAGGRPGADGKPGKPGKPEKPAPEVPAEPSHAGQPGSCTPAAEGSPAYKKLVQAYRKDQSLHGECIRGGFFSKYDGGTYRYKGCKAPDVTYSEMVNGKNETKHLVCSNGKQPCNVVTFCHGIDFDRPGKNGAAGTKGFFPGQICAKVDAHFTESCDRELDNNVGKPMSMGAMTPAQAARFAQYKDKPTRLCDPVKDIPNMKLHDFYSKLNDSTNTKYKQLCEGNKNFRALFCEECDHIGKHITGMVQIYLNKHARLEPQAEPPAGGERRKGRAPPGHQPVDSPDAKREE